MFVFIYFFQLFGIIDKNKDGLFSNEDTKILTDEVTIHFHLYHLVVSQKHVMSVHPQLQRFWLSLVSVVASHLGHIGYLYLSLSV